MVQFPFIFIISTSLLGMAQHSVAHQMSTVFVPVVGDELKEASFCPLDGTIPLDSFGFSIQLRLSSQHFIGLRNETNKCLRYYVCYMSEMALDKQKPWLSTAFMNLPNNLVSAMCGPLWAMKNARFHGIGVELCQNGDDFNGTIRFSFIAQELNFKFANDRQKWTNLSVQFGLNGVKMKKGDKELKKWATVENDGYFYWQGNKMFQNEKSPLWMVILDFAYIAPLELALAKNLSYSSRSLMDYFRMFQVIHPPDCRLAKEYVGRRGGGWSIVIECWGNGVDGENSLNEEAGKNGTCGLRHSQHRPAPLTGLVSGGKSVNDSTKWPWLVALHATFLVLLDGKGQMDNLVKKQCTGTIIGRQHILTAAHCVAMSPSDKVDGVKITESNTKLVGIVAKAGQPNYKHFNTQIRFGSRVYLPEHVVKLDGQPDNDIAIIKLAHPLDFNERILPICLSNRSIATVLGEAVTMLGWGFTKEFDIATEEFQEQKKNAISEVNLHEGKGVIISRNECIQAYCEGIKDLVIAQKRYNPYAEEAYKALAEEYMSRHKICVAGQEGVNIQAGDSGGPLLKYNNNTRRYETLAVLSTQMVRASPQNKIGPALYIDVNLFGEWIKMVKDGNIEANITWNIWDENEKGQN